MNWGSFQKPVIHDFYMSGDTRRKLVDDTELSLTFFERIDDKKLVLFVDILDKTHISVPF